MSNSFPSVSGIQAACGKLHKDVLLKIVRGAYVTLHQTS
jgi:hypothetical protein